MTRRGMAAALLVLALAGCSSSVLTPDDLASELGGLGGVASATGESLSGNPDQRSSAAFYVKVADDATPANVSAVVRTWLDRAPGLRKGHLSLVIAEPDATSSFALDTLAGDDLPGTAARWFELTQQGDVRATLHAGSTEFAIDAADPSVVLAAMPPRDDLRLRLAVDGVEVAVLDAGSCTFGGPRGEELWIDWRGPGYCATTDRN